MKEDVMSFTRIEIDQNETRVFNLDPQNVPTYNRQQLYMGISIKKTFTRCEK